MIKLYANKFLICVKQNGFAWSIYRFGSRYSPIAKNFFLSKLKKIELRNNIPGLNTFEQNYRFWNDYDWKRGGEEWSVDKEWKEKLKDMIITNEISNEDTVLEIGPGTGRMTKYLLQQARQVIGVEISRKCVDILNDTFRKSDNFTVYHIDSISLPFVKNKSIDIIFSYDVFVHIDKVVFEKYFSEFDRILKPDGKIVIHYNKTGEKEGTFFSKFNERDFNYLLSKFGFKLVNDIDPYLLRDNIPTGKGSGQSVSILKRN